MHDKLMLGLPALKIAIAQDTTVVHLYYTRWNDNKDYCIKYTIIKSVLFRCLMYMIRIDKNCLLCFRINFRSSQKSIPLSSTGFISS